MKNFIALEILNKLKNKMLNFTSIDVENATIQIEAMQEHNRELFLKIIKLTKQRDEAIAELEALQQPKSCAKCKAFKLDDEHNDGFGQCFWGIRFPSENSFSYHKGTDFYCSEFEPKEQ